VRDREPGGRGCCHERFRSPGRPVTAPVAGTSAYALLTDGTTVEIRHAGPPDAAAVREMHVEMSPDNVYRRFFSFSARAGEQEARRLCRKPGPDHAALLAWLGGRLVGVASYEPTDRSGVAEIAFAVPDDMHGRGIATLLLEHLVSLARRRQLRAFTAETLWDNAAMLGVFADAGLPVQRHLSDGVVSLTFPLPGSDADESLDGYLETVARRESRADVASFAQAVRRAPAHRSRTRVVPRPSIAAMSHYRYSRRGNGPLTSLARPMSQATLARNIRICADMRTWHDGVSDSLGVKERGLQAISAGRLSAAVAVMRGRTP
jgi:RimJ/RimL family protein N-acetyltransferase